MRTLQPLWVLGYGQEQPHAPRRHDIGPGAYAGRRDVAADGSGGDGTGGSWIILTTDVLAAHSGGPVVDASGAVIGWCLLSLTGGTSHPHVESYAGGLHAARPINSALPALRRIADRVRAIRWVVSRLPVKLQSRILTLAL